LSRAQQSGIAALLDDYREFGGGRLWLAFALMILGALVEGFGLLLIVPLASMAIDGGDARLVHFAPWLAGWTSNQRFVAALGLFVAAMAIRSLLLFSRDVLLARLATEYEASLRLRSAATLATRGWPFASRIGQAGMQSLLLTDVPRAAQAVTYLQSMSSAATMLVVALLLTLLLSPRLTLVALLFLAVAFPLSRKMTRKAVASGHAISEATDFTTGSGFRLHAGLKAALAQGTVPAFIDEYGSSLRRTASHYSSLARHYSSARQWAAFGAALAAAALLLVGVRWLALPFPVVAASLVLFARMTMPAQVLQNSLIQVAADAPAFAAIQRRLGKLEQHIPRRIAGERLEWARLEVVSAAYAYRLGCGLGEISFTMSRGDWIGIRGASGTGKTTLLDLIAGLLSPQAGQIRVDGRQLDDVIDRWRGQLGYVSQDGIVFSDSVRANLAADSGESTDEELWNALETVGLSQRVRAFTEGLDEHVGDRGSQLSGGERQRLVLARALLRRPALLILDEATAALDLEAERELIGRLKAFHTRPAALLVAHRESTLGHCDAVVSIRHGTANEPV
jgi:ATP-binding cassette subfamily C protein